MMYVIILTKFFCFSNIYHIIIVYLQFEGQEIDIDLRVGIFITMNPGYAGRTELPESVKALFRPVVVIVPDLQQICEIMLFSEGFLVAKVSRRICFIICFTVITLSIKQIGFCKQCRPRSDAAECSI